MRAQPKKGGYILGAGQVKKGSLPRNIPVLDIYVSASLERIIGPYILFSIE